MSWPSGVSGWVAFCPPCPSGRLLLSAVAPTVLPSYLSLSGSDWVLGFFILRAQQVQVDKSVAICWEKENFKNNLPRAEQACCLPQASCLHCHHPRAEGWVLGFPLGGRQAAGLRGGLLFPSGNSCCAVSCKAGVALLPVGLLFAQLFWPAPRCQDCHPGNSGRTWPASELAGVSPAVGRSGHLVAPPQALLPSKGTSLGAF